MSSGPDVIGESELDERRVPGSRVLHVEVEPEFEPSGTVAAAAHERARRTLRPGDAIADVGDGGFVVVLGSPCGDAEAAAAASRLEERLGEPFEIGGQIVDVTVTVVAEHPSPSA